MTETSGTPTSGLDATAGDFRFGPEDPRTCEQRLEDLQCSARQGEALRTRQKDITFRRELLRLMQQQRIGRDDVVQFDVIDDPRGEELLAVVGELLVRSEALTRDGISELLDELGLSAEEVACLDGRVTRLRLGGAGRSDLDDAANRLRARGVQVSMSYVPPMGIVMKGHGGAEPSAGPGPEPDESQPKGEPVRVAVIDTGVVERDDGWLRGVANDTNRDPLDDFPAGGDGFLDFGAGHGTFAAGLVAQVAPHAEILVFRGLDSGGLGSEVDIACLLVQAVRDHGATVVNLSVGTETIDDNPPVALEVAMEIVEEFQVENGVEVVVVAAAGNFGRDRPCWPAALNGVVAVGALTPDLRPATWSSRGFWLKCSTVGENVRSTYVPGTESPFIDSDPDTFGPDSWALWAGTSFASPQIAGAVAQIAQVRGVSTRYALAMLLRTGRRIPDYGRAVEILHFA